MLSKLDAFAQEAYFLNFFLSFQANSRFANQNQKRHLLSKDFFPTDKPIELTTNSSH